MIQGFIIEVVFTGYSSTNRIPPFSENYDWEIFFGFNLELHICIAELNRRFLFIVESNWFSVTINSPVFHQ
jgi:hypothetical protein